MSHEYAKGSMAIVLASLLWGTTGTAASYSPDVSPMAIGAFAMGFGGVMLCFSARNYLVRDFSKLHAHPKLFLFGCLCIAIYPLAFYTSMRLAGVAIGTVISIASGPLFAAILERVVSKKTISVQWFISFIFGVIGVVLLALGKTTANSELATVHTPIIGILLGLIAGLTYAGYSWVAKQLIDSGVNSQSAMGGMFGGAAMLLLPSLLFTGKNLFASDVNTTVALYMAVVPMFIGYLLFGYGLRSVEVSNATLITLIEPIIATLLAIYLLGEGFNKIGWLGMGMISVCLLIQSIKVEPSTAGWLPDKRSEKV
jgi:DME family drug/metabolite transporter